MNNINPKRTIRLILHGKSAQRADIRDAVAEIRGAGHRVQVCVTWEGGDTVRFAQQAALDGIDTVVACGGDGTINEVALGLAVALGTTGPKPSLGVVPLGTANDFARACGIPLNPLEALRLVVERPASSVDLGRVGDRAFVNVATGGFGTKITVETSEDLKKVFGGAAYLITGLTKFGALASSKARFLGPDFEWEGNFLVLAVGNGRQAGGGHMLCPTALIDDGLLDLNILPDVPPGELGVALQTLLNEGLAAIEGMIVSASLPWVEVESEEDLFINLDGEPVSGTKFRFEILPSALQLHLPSNSPVLS